MSQTIPAALGWTASSLLGDVSAQARHDQDKTAVIWEHGSLTYGDLRNRSMRLASALREKGLSTGDRVASFLFNRGEVVELYFACAYAGLTYVPLNFRLTASEVTSILRDCDARLLFTETELEGTASTAIAQIGGGGPKLVVLDATSGGGIYDEMATKSDVIASRYACDLQMILYTSGSTGTPKGVTMRAISVLWLGLQQAMLFRMDDSSVVLLNAPMCNTAAINEFFVATFITGATLAIMPSRKWSTERLCDFIQRWKVTHTCIFPSMFPGILEADDRSKRNLASMRCWISGGENCPPAVMSAARKQFPHIHLIIGYGSTETGIPTMIEGEDIDKHPGSCGRVIAGQAIRILDSQGNELGPDEVGEVWTSGPAVMTNYWNAPSLDAETVRDGWLKLGDLGRMDKNGWLYIVGRSKDMVISKGQNIYPAEVENVILRHPAVAAVKVFGIPDEEFGEAVCAAVVLVKGQSLTKADLMSFILSQLSSYKKPRHLHFLDALPTKNDTKVDKFKLTEIFTDLIAAQNVEQV